MIEELRTDKTVRKGWHKVQYNQEMYSMRNWREVRVWCLNNGSGKRFYQTGTNVWFEDEQDAWLFRLFKM
jgi:hypothetical protein